MSGGSNSIIFAMAILNYLVPGLLDAARDSIATGILSFLDVVLDAEGNVIKATHEDWGTFAVVGRGTNALGAFDPAISDQLGAEFARESEGHTRITLLVGQYWTNSEMLLQAAMEGPWLGTVADDHAWKNSKRVFFAQVMQWYLVCGIHNIAFCNRADIFKAGADATLAAFESEMTAFMAMAERLCSGDAMAGCFVSTNTFSSSQVGILQPFITKAKEVTAKYGAVRFLDFYTLSSKLAGEVIDNHAMPSLLLWQLALILNTVCEADTSGGVADRGCHQRVSFSPECTGTQGVVMRGPNSECPTYESYCEGGRLSHLVPQLECKAWECGNSRDPGCTVKVDAGSASGEDAWECTRAIVHPALALNETCGAPEPDRCAHRLWCRDGVPNWALTVMAVAVAVFVWLRLNLAELSKDIMETFTPITPNNGTTWSKMQSPPPAGGKQPGGAGDRGDDGANGDMESWAASSSEVAAVKPKPPKEFLTALAFVRYLASLHIVVGHIKAKGFYPGCYFCSHGFTWVPFFFVLSGFVLTHARLGSRDPSKVDGPAVHFWKRSATIYPMYAVAVLGSAVIRMKSDQELPAFGVLTAQIFLVQAFYPDLVSEALALHCWFLSCLAVYWLGFGAAYRRVRTQSTLQAGATLAVCAALPWLIVVVPKAAGLDPLWYREDAAKERWWFLFVKFNPLCYAHVFLFGMALARLRTNVRGTRVGAALFEGRFSPTGVLGLLVLLVVFAVEDARPEAALLSTRLSVLLPLQGMVLVGLSGRNNVFARAFSFKPLQFLGKFSYAQYLIQFIVYALWKQGDLGSPHVHFYVFLAAVSYVFQMYVGEPARRLWMQTAEVRGRVVPLAPLAAPFLLLLALGVCSAVHTVGPAAPATAAGPCAPPAPLPAAWADVRLPLRCAGCAEHVAIINPSLAFLNGTVHVAARAHRRTNQTRSVQLDGTTMTETTLVWDSEIAVGQLPVAGGDRLLTLGLDRGANLAPLRVLPSTFRGPQGPEAEAWSPCERRAVVDAAARTVHRLRTTGPEDPQLVPHPEGGRAGLALAFSSYPPPAVLPGGACDPAYAVHQMFAVGAPLDAGAPAAGVRLKCGFTKVAEKNWVPFQYEGQPFFVYSINPHKVVAARLQDGACAEKHVTVHDPLSALQMARPDVRVRGSGAATLHKGSYYALLHTRDGNSHYHTFPYRFAGQPPFQVEAVSARPLPLSRRAFASSLLLVPEHGKAVVGYGLGDAESRALVLELADLEEQLRCGEGAAPGAGARSTSMFSWMARPAEGGGGAGGGEGSANGCTACINELSECAGCLECIDPLTNSWRPGFQCRECRESADCTWCLVQRQCYAAPRAPASGRMSEDCHICHATDLSGCAGCRTCERFDYFIPQAPNTCGACLQHCGRCRGCFGSAEVAGRGTGHACGTCLPGGMLSDCAGCVGALDKPGFCRDRCAECVTSGRCYEGQGKPWAPFV